MRSPGAGFGLPEDELVDHAGEGAFCWRPLPGSARSTPRSLPKAAGSSFPYRAPGSGCLAGSGRRFRGRAGMSRIRGRTRKCWMNLRFVFRALFHQDRLARRFGQCRTLRNGSRLCYSRNSLPGRCTSRHRQSVSRPVRCGQIQFARKRQWQRRWRLRPAARLSLRLR